MVLAAVSLRKWKLTFKKEGDLSAYTSGEIHWRYQRSKHILQIPKNSKNYSTHNELHFTEAETVSDTQNTRLSSKKGKPVWFTYVVLLKKDQEQSHYLLTTDVTEMAEKWLWTIAHPSACPEHQLWPAQKLKRKQKSRRPKVEDAATNQHKRNSTRG